MKIVDDRELLKKFVDLNIGDAFEYAGYYAMKTQRIVYESAGVDVVINAINLKTNKHLTMYDDNLVTPIKTELHILG